MVKRTERGWAGHFICAYRCRFRRNTLLECGEKRVVVSTVGMMASQTEDKFEPIGYNRYFETMAFHAHRVDDRYWDADVSRQIFFDSPWAIGEIDADDKANDMHDNVVFEIIDKLSDEYDFGNKEDSEL
jgi:hypothetical protein